MADQAIQPDMRRRTLLKGLALVPWLIVIVFPLGWLLTTMPTASLPEPEDLPLSRYLLVLFRTSMIGCILATFSLLAAWPAARLIGGHPWARTWGPLFLIIPLLIPPQINFYAWGLLVTPNSTLGTLINRSDYLIMLSNFLRSGFALGLWYWPLCALILGLAWHRTDPDTWAQAKLDAGPLRRWWWIGLPMLRNAMILSWLIVFVMVLSQFVVFHLAGVDTLGTELSSLYQMTGSVHAVAWASLPMIIPAAIVAGFMNHFFKSIVQTCDFPASERCWKGHWYLAGGLWIVSTLIPIILLATGIQGPTTFVQFGQVSLNGLIMSLILALGTAVLTLMIAMTTVLNSRRSPFTSFIRWTTIFTALLPGSMIAVAMVDTFNPGILSNVIYNQPWMVSIGHTAQFGFLGILVLSFAKSSLPPQIADLTKIDGAEGFSALTHVWLPGLWPALLASLLLIVTLSITELPATMVLLPAGVPNFAQELLNQMHYARDQQVIASCLILFALAIVVAALIFIFVKLGKFRSTVFSLVFVAALAAGCDQSLTSQGDVHVLNSFGGTGRGPAQFIYPRAITIAPDDSLFIVDKTARVQHLTQDGKSLAAWTMPEFQTGKPVGLFYGPDNNVYVADTHYHRVMVYAPDGKLLNKFGTFGTGPGQFIYPTDVDIAPDGRIFVSEYGGNDRISIFSPDFKFLSSFGSLGEKNNQFSRPSAICIDRKTKILHVADACNHRIIQYDLNGRFLTAFGTPGDQPGQMRYPYDINLAPDGSLLVAEYGNNRIQRFSPDGKSLGLWGRPGRELGQVLYPWGVVIDSQGRVVVLDSGNNRVQVWKIL